MIELTCPNCSAQLRAKAKLAGTVRKCPKCGGALSIPAPEPPSASGGKAAAGQAGRQPDRKTAGIAPEPAAQQHAERGTEEHLAAPEIPNRLNRQNHYLICSRNKLVAVWENNGQGWMVNTGHGLVSAARNQGELPAQGDFRLIELHLAATEHGRRLTGLRAYHLAPRWALPALARGDHDVMAKITGPAGLDRDQKTIVRGVLRDQFMPDVWHQSQTVLDYLGNTDYHSPGAGDSSDPAGDG